jgi:hypothetical protein
MPGIKKKKKCLALALINVWLVIYTAEYRQFYHQSNLEFEMASFSTQHPDELQQYLTNILKTKFRAIHGTDTDGKEYKSLKLLYKHMFSTSNKRKMNAEAAGITPSREKKDEWYEKAFNYWEDPQNCPVSDGKVS